MSLLRKYIRHIILESEDDDDKDGPPDDLLTEPDFVEDPDEEGKDIRKEISAISGGGGAMASTNKLAGAMAGPTYPGKRTKKKGKKRKGKHPTYGTLSSDD